MLKTDVCNHGCTGKVSWAIMLLKLFLFYIIHPCLVY